MRVVILGVHSGSGSTTGLLLQRLLLLDALRDRCVESENKMKQKKCLNPEKKSSPISEFLASKLVIFITVTLLFVIVFII